MARVGLAMMSASAVLALSSAAPVVAQETTSRPVVQPLPSPQVQRLNRALMELARRPGELGPLIEAGTASFELKDFDAAIGFFGRAEQLVPGNPHVALGMAKVFLHSGRAGDALTHFSRALAAGAPTAELLTDQALAFDLVGEHEAAQSAYIRALSLDPDDLEARRRLAVSHAITGNRARFEEALRPLLETRDVAAFRTRAFGLAIMGDYARATAIVDQVMPRDLAGQLTPYLAFMPRLTTPQQAAAANLGIFPSASDIGREDPRLARFASEGAAGNKLEPAGLPLGTRVTLPTQEPIPAPTQVAASQATRQIVPQISEPSVPASVPISVADAFDDLEVAELPRARADRDAVDLAAIAIPREARPAPPERKPEPEAHPSRIWVQVATGRDVAALGFDWRRIARKAGDLLAGMKPHVTPWGEANRLLAGPLESPEDARALIKALKQAGLDTFSYTSPKGTAITLLK